MSIHYQDDKDLFIHYFNKLNRLKKEHYNGFLKQYYGIFRSVIEKYSDRTHFIYELLQNADDTGATKIQFLLTAKGLWFKHNGTERFSISDPSENENEDVDLGHINSITGIGDSNKRSKIEKSMLMPSVNADQNFNGTQQNTDLEDNELTKEKPYETLESEFKSNKIGKFGVGFKSVFSYTDMPFIYDEYHFYISNFIIPESFNPDKQYKPMLRRESNETVFFFPFKPSIKDAFKEIKTALSHLYYPLMHIFNITNITCQVLENDQITNLSEYKKEISLHENLNIEQQIIDKISIKQKKYFQDVQNEEDFIVFQKEIQLAGKGKFHKISIAFPCLYQDGKPLRVYTNQKYQSFCFFSIENSIKLGYIIHAPFLLTESRAAFLLQDETNRQLMEQLGLLIKKALLNLREHQLLDDQIIDILFCDPNIVQDSLYQFYQPLFKEIATTLKHHQILPGRNHNYFYSHQAYWPSDPELVQLFTDEYLRVLYHKDNIGFVFTTKTYKYIEQNNKPLYHYLKDLTSANIYPDLVIGQINLDFMNHLKMDSKWLISFYRYLQNHNTMKDILIKKNTLYIPNQNNEMVQFFRTPSQVLAPIYFSFDRTIKQYSHVNVNCVRDDIEKDVACKDFLISLGVGYIDENVKIISNLKDFINNYKQYFSENQYIDNIKLAIQYVNSNQSNMFFVDEIYKLFRESSFLVVNQNEYCHPRDVYWPSTQINSYQDNLQVSLKTISDPLFLKYFKAERESLLSFFKRLGVSTIPRLNIRRISLLVVGPQILSKFNLSSQSTKPYQYKEYISEVELDQLDGNQLEQKASIDLANLLISILDEHLKNDQNCLYAKLHSFKKNKEIVTPFEGEIFEILRKKKWLFDVNSHRVSPQELNQDASRLHPNIQMNSLILNLIFKKQEQGIEAWFQSMINQHGKEIFHDIKEMLNRKLNRRNPKFTNQKPKVTSLEEISKDPEYQNQETLEQLQNHLNREYERLDKIKALDNILSDPSNRYQYRWFISILEKEALLSSKESAYHRKIKLIFNGIQLEKAGNHANNPILILKTSEYIDPTLEEENDLILLIEYENQNKEKRLISIRIAVAQVEEGLLRLKLLDPITKLNEIHDESKVRAILDVSRVTFLRDKLLKGFEELKYEQKNPIPAKIDLKANGTFNLKQHLSPHLSFVFGPPGTGKTTHLADDIIQKMKDQDQKLKVLVLTPTNKSADVLAERILNRHAAVQNWLLRLGTCINDQLLQAQIVIDNTFAIDTRCSNSLTLITTIARYPYECFRAGANTERQLKKLEWDYIIFDEASMIPITDIIYVIYSTMQLNQINQKQTKFIIAGDPFQIKPVSLIKEIQDENIYELVGLKSFTQPKTEPHAYPVKLLTTQYRSVPSVANLFNHYLYGGLINHQRSENSLPPLNTTLAQFKSIQTIYFDVNVKPVYRVRALNSSPYQIYSALFTVEFAVYLYQEIVRQGLDLKIGIICPYAAQAQMIDKTISVYKTNIIVGTVHKFQGDECDIILAVFNPPKKINSSVFLNQKNILNVAISRSKNYLFVIRPFSYLKGSQYLHELNHISDLIQKAPSCRYFRAQTIENTLWGSPNYIEQCTFISGHQSVNIYSHYINRYEVRAEAHALDVQVNLALGNIKQTVLPQEMLNQDQFDLNTDPYEPQDKQDELINQMEDEDDK